MATASRRTELSAGRITDGLGWILTGVAALAAHRLPDMIATQTAGDVRALISHGSLFLVGAFSGTLRPSRPWRWGLASLVAYAAGDLFHLGSGAQLPEVSLYGVWTHIVTGGPDWLFHALPVVIGAYAGAYLVSTRLK